MVLLLLGQVRKKTRITEAGLEIVRDYEFLFGYVKLDLVWNTQVVFPAGRYRSKTKRSQDQKCSSGAQPQACREQRRN